MKSKKLDAYRKNIDKNGACSSIYKGSKKSLFNALNSRTSKDCNENTVEISNHKEGLPVHLEVLCYLSFQILILLGHFKEFLRAIGIMNNKLTEEPNREGYVKLLNGFDTFIARNIFKITCDTFGSPISSMPGTFIDIIDRTSDDNNWTFEYPGTTTKALNIGSYNYLGFAENSGPNVHRVKNSINKYGVGVSTTRQEIGTTAIHNQLETLVAQFLGVESSIVFGMGFATNSTNIPSLAGKGTLIMSDEYNHASLILGSRISGASIRVFKHNDMKELEEKIRNNIVEGQPKTHRPWKKIIIIVEGIYSMEGTIVNLPEVIRLKKKYKCYLYVDEAHSIGALGQSGRGVCDYFGCDPNDVDLLMGTFTKSFNAAGGYIAGRKNTIDFIAMESRGATYGSSMAPCIVQQIISALNVIMGIDGTDDGLKRIARLSRNSRYLRRRLKQMGFVVLGDQDSPIIPVLVGFSSKLADVFRKALKKGIGLAVIGYPITSLTTGRIRFCVSAAHTKDMLDKVLDVIDQVGDEVGVKYKKQQKSVVDIAF